MDAVVYDIEIKKAILGKNESPIEGIEYCAGWQDHANMGISSIAAYDYAQDRYRLFMDDNLGEFYTLCQSRDVIVTFNGLSFDNKVVNAQGQNITEEPAKHYDLLVEIWAAAGLGPQFKYPSHIGFSLDACAEANMGQRKTGNGAHAPVQFQRGEYGALIDYNLTDVWLTKRLFDRVMDNGQLIDPRDSSKRLTMRRP